MTRREKCSFVVWFSLQRSEMSIEHDSSSRLHSSGVQCRVLLESVPLFLSVQFFQHVTLSYRKLLICDYNPSEGHINFSFYDWLSESVTWWKTRQHKSRNGIRSNRLIPLMYLFGGICKNPLPAWPYDTPRSNTRGSFNSFNSNKQLLDYADGGGAVCTLSHHSFALF